MTASSLVARPDALLAGPLGSFEAYADRVSRIAVLSREEELELARRFGVATTGVPDAIASRYGRPKPSYVDGDTNTQALR